MVLKTLLLSMNTAMRFIASILRLFLHNKRGLPPFRCLPPPKLVIRISYVHNSIPSISEVKTNCRHGDYTEIDKRPQLKSRNAPNIGGFALVYRQFPLARRTQKNLLGAALRETFRPAFCFRACAL